MPNWTQNRLTVKGSPEDVNKFASDVYSDGEDCPQYAKNKNSISTGSSVITPNDLAFWKVVPVPPSVLAKGYTEAGYDWEIKNWGCKWGSVNVAVDSSNDGEIEYDFGTPWNAPLTWLNQVAKKYPSLTFELSYKDEDGGSDYRIWQAKSDKGSPNINMWGDYNEDMANKINKDWSETVKKVNSIYKKNGKKPLKQPLKKGSTVSDKVKKPVKPRKPKVDPTKGLADEITKSILEDPEGM